jgi:hypothetical protein
MGDDVGMLGLEQQRKHRARRRDWIGWVGVRKRIRLGNIYLGLVVG